MELYFRFGGEVAKIKIDGKNLFFTTSNSGFNQWSPIDGLRLSKAGILKEFPDLSGKPEAEIRLEGIKKFKEKIKKMNNENEIKNYIVEDLKKHGYTLQAIQRKGWRTQKIKEDDV